jgi:hypothetical protein
MALSPLLDDVCDCTLCCFLAINPINLAQHVVITVTFVVHLFGKRLVRGIDGGCTTTRHWIGAHPAKTAKGLGA